MPSSVAAAVRCCWRVDHRPDRTVRLPCTSRLRPLAPPAQHSSTHHRMFFRTRDTAPNTYGITRGICTWNLQTPLPPPGGGASSRSSSSPSSSSLSSPKLSSSSAPMSSICCGASCSLELPAADDRSESLSASLHACGPSTRHNIEPVTSSAPSSPSRSPLGALLARSSRQSALSQSAHGLIGIGRTAKGGGTDCLVLTAHRKAGRRDSVGQGYCGGACACLCARAREGKSGEVAGRRGGGGRGEGKSKHA
eukprot:COSAG01_NODE_8906_length_2620_cov_2.646965_4_plen_250_part_01